MKIRTAIMLCAAGTLSYLMIGGIMELQKRYDELEEYEKDIEEKAKMTDMGIDRDNVIDVKFDDV